VSTPLRLGISTCPNDTYAFHGLLSGAVAATGLELEIELHDVQELNERLLAGALDAAKASFHAALRAGAELVVLPCGAALGFGLGPVLLAPSDRATPPDPLVLCPGEWTTATLLWRLLHPGEGHVEQVVFDQIMPALAEGRADLGVCIHEGRFTWRAHGLRLVEDLGSRWERRTCAPLPLGGIVARRDLGTRALESLRAAIARSLEHARAHPEAALATMRRHAQEQRDEVLWAHVELYVNNWTRDLGRQGRGALEALRRAACEAGLIAPDAPALEVFEG